MQADIKCYLLHAQHIKKYRELSVPGTEDPHLRKDKLLLKREILLVRSTPRENISKLSL
jgi:hypothetical protein